MKNKLTLSILIICLTICSCARNTANENITPSGESDIISPPSLFVIYNGTKTEATKGTFSWTENGISAAGDAFHPLEQVKRDWMTPIKIDTNNVISLEFDKTPSALSVRYWSEKYIGDSDSYESNYKRCEVQNNTIHIPTDGNYVFEVKAQWRIENETGGSAYYGFYIEKE